jgi:Arc/MetJ-type ribon-helix-helix transcriptional regulator
MNKNTDKNENDTFWHIRVRKTLDKILEDFIEKDTHSNKSEFIRAAVRERLERLGVNLGIERS